MLTSASTAAVESVTRPETEAFVDWARRPQFSKDRTSSAQTDTRPMSQPADLETLSVRHEEPVSSELRSSRLLSAVSCAFVGDVADVVRIETLRMSPLIVEKCG